MNFFINRPIFIKFKCSLLITGSSLLLKSPCKFSFFSVFPVFSGLFCAFERISLRERPEGGWQSANETRFLPSEAGEKTRLRRALSGRHSGLRTVVQGISRSNKLVCSSDFRVCVGGSDLCACAKCVTAAKGHSARGGVRKCRGESVNSNVSQNPPLFVPGLKFRARTVIFRLTLCRSPRRRSGLLKTAPDQTKGKQTWAEQIVRRAFFHGRQNGNYLAK